MFAAVELSGQSQTGQAADAKTRDRGALSEAESVKAEQTASEVSVSVEGSGDK